MNLRRRKPRPLSREDKTFRDDRLFVIATEDTYSPDRYFRIFHNPRIKVRVLPTEAGFSASSHVLDRLDAFAKEYELTGDDELWLMLDTDHWAEPNHVANFDRVCKEAVEKGFHLAHSNPCFEIWLLLHVEDLNPSDRFKSCEEVVRRLREALGAYSKRTIPGSCSPSTAAIAVDRAERLDGGSNDRWPQRTGSHVYRVVKALFRTEDTPSHS